MNDHPNPIAEAIADATELPRVQGELAIASRREGALHMLCSYTEKMLETALERIRKAPKVCEDHFVRDDPPCVLCAENERWAEGIAGALGGKGAGHYESGDPLDTVLCEIGEMRSAILEAPYVEKLMFIPMDDPVECARAMAAKLREQMDKDEQQWTEIRRQRAVIAKLCGHVLKTNGALPLADTVAGLNEIEKLADEGEKLIAEVWDNPDAPDRTQAILHIGGLRDMLDDLRPRCDCGATGDAVHHLECPHIQGDWPIADIKAGEWPMAGT